MTSQQSTSPLLGAVNKILLDNKQSRVSQIDSEEIAATTTAALDALTEASQNLQSEGWDFNREFGLTLKPRDADGHILLPSDYISFVSRTDPDIVMRGGKLYNKALHTYEFTGSEAVDAVIFLEFDDLPPHAQSIVKEEASLIYQQRLLGSATLNEMAARRVHDARVRLKQDELSINPVNMLTGIGEGAPPLNRTTVTR